MAFKIASTASGVRAKPSFIQFANWKSEAGWAELADVSHFNTKRLAQCCGVSVRQLERKFREEFKVSPKKWLQIRRVEAARNLSNQGWRPKKIAAALHFKTVSHFCKTLKAALEPTDERRRPQPRFRGSGRTGTR